MVETLPPQDESPLHVPSPEAAEGTQLHAFVAHCAEAIGRDFADPADFYAWTVADYRVFWRLFLDWSGVAYEGAADEVCRGDAVETAEFFPELRLSYVENLIEARSDRLDELAIVACHADADPVRVTRRELRRRVIAVARSFQQRGLGDGDRVVAVATNTEALIVAGLAALTVGATLSTAAPEMGVDSILARFQQLAPTLLVLGPTETARAADLVAGLPSLTWVLALDEMDVELPVAEWRLADLVREGDIDEPFEWPRLPFNQPLFILFSSGTTGPPKCIVHSAGGVLLEHRKELALHENLDASDTLFFHTNPAWMMWNWQLSALSLGTTIVLYDGRVFAPDTLWSVVAAEGVTAFGTGPSYLRFCANADYVPRTEHDLSRLRAIMSTGSVLRDDQYDWIIDNVGTIPIHSISGGTDIVGCFVLGNPMLSVHRGEAQCRSLGLDVRAHNADPVTGVGELICANPFPSRPLGLFGDSDGSRFHAAYFAANDGVWTHGDLFEVTEHGGARLHGRSDSVLNVGGIRIGPAEIYSIVNALDTVQESLVVEQHTPDQLEMSRLVLLVVLTAPGTFDGAAEVAVRRAISRGASPMHVPKVIVEVPELPRTFSGKDSEAAVRDALNGAPVRNLQALMNPACLETITAAVRQSDDERERAAADTHDASTVGVLCAIFAELLGVAHVRPDDSFFDLGGTSLGLATARQMIFDRLAHDVPLSAIFAAPRPAALAEYLARPALELRDSLILLRPGSADARPLFMIHDVTGDVLAYTRLANALPVDRPMYGIRAKALDSRLDPDLTIDDMAGSALEATRLVQDKGPYTLVGFSFGGMVAFEMARTLVAAGEAVDHLVLLDSYVDPACLGRWRGLWFRGVQRPLVHLGRLARAPRASIHRAWLRILRRAGKAAPVDPAATPLATALEQRAGRELTRWRPHPYRGDVVFVRALERDPLQCEPVGVWRDATQGSFRVVATAGGHNDSLAEPHVGLLGTRLGTFLG